MIRKDDLNIGPLRLLPETELFLNCGEDADIAWIGFALAIGPASGVYVSLTFT